MNQAVAIISLVPDRRQRHVRRLTISLGAAITKRIIAMRWWWTLRHAERDTMLKGYDL